MNDQRSHERYSAEYQKGLKTNLMFMYEVMDESIVDEIRIHREGVSTILNISAGGCLIHSHSPFPPETRLLITMTPPAFPDQKIIVTGMIARMVAEARDAYCCGVKFIEYHENSKAVLENFITRLETAAGAENG